MAGISPALESVRDEDVLVDLIHDRLVCDVFGDTESDCARLQLLDAPQPVRAVLARALLELTRLHRVDCVTGDERELVDLLDAGGPGGDEPER